MLLHTCCAPCLGYVFEVVSQDFEVTAFYYNPNISPKDEYNLRLKELIDYSKKRGFPVIEGQYNHTEWLRAIKPYRLLGERSERCNVCYRFRLEETFNFAKENGFDIVATVLSISPHKIAAWINEAGNFFGEKYGVDFFEADFKKKDGYKKSVEISKANDFYRQDYCGCIYSKLERDPSSIWYKKVLEYREKNC